MKTEMDPNTQTDDQYSPEKFPQPRTYPNGRNLESSFHEWNSSNAQQTHPISELEVPWEPEKFPKTTTYPSGWDLSGIYTESKPRN